jgi:hypothetical protein
VRSPRSGRRSDERSHALGVRRRAAATVALVYAAALAVVVLILVHSLDASRRVLR